LTRKKIGHASCPVELRRRSYVGVQSSRGRRTRLRASG
jgi:hypothetical protein